MLDSIVFEQQGIPSASIITHLFRATGNAMARTWGLEGFRYLETQHPIANLTSEQLDERAAKLAPEVAQLLLEGQKG
ncbi:MAG: hypothetical protein FJY56_13390 [Betaproteobacteria bacterium]|nr:hypothetical protein [Betaproteobacteria bacterium]